jgi:hypothetical protein
MGTTKKVRNAILSRVGTAQGHEDLISCLFRRAIEISLITRPTVQYLQARRFEPSFR